LHLFLLYTWRKTGKKTGFLDKYHQLILVVFLGFMTAIHYMTNAFDGPIYILLIGFALLFIFGLRKELFIYSSIVGAAFLVFSYPFSSHFSPFVTGIGVNCSPDFLVNIKSWGPFLFEKEMPADPSGAFTLWGFSGPLLFFLYG
jgi:hypothetical protein